MNGKYIKPNILLEEVKFQIDMLEQGGIDKDDFILAITEIYEHYQNHGNYSKYGINMLDWYKKS